MESKVLTRTVVSEGGYDVVVAGGGPAGSAAAIAAARLGAKVLLVEATGCLGGMGTSALVSLWYSLCDGETMITRGIVRELTEQLHQRGYLKPGTEPTKWWKTLYGGFGFNPEGLKLILDEFCREAGVEVRFFTRLIDADFREQRLHGVFLNNVEGHRYIESKTFIDATGDAILTNLCGLKCREAGRDTAKIMPPTLCSVSTGIDSDLYLSRGAPMKHEAVLRGIKDGFFSQPDRHVPGLMLNGNTTATLNAGHIFGMNALNCRSLSDGMMRGRQLADEYTRFFRAYVEGCQEMTLAATASLMGVRESRRIVGEYELNLDDYKARRSFRDQIGIYNKVIDIHVYDTSDEEWERFQQEWHGERPGPGEYYGIPYGILVPKDALNLWVAGRCHSSDVNVNGAIRDQPACYMMGQAAGTAAVQSIRTGEPACDLDTATLVEALRSQGAYLPQVDLQPTMTRS